MRGKSVDSSGLGINTRSRTNQDLDYLSSDEEDSDNTKDNNIANADSTNLEEKRLTTVLMFIQRAFKSILELTGIYSIISSSQQLDRNSNGGIGHSNINSRTSNSKGELSSSSGYDTDDDIDIFESDQMSNYNQSSILSTVLFNTRDYSRPFATINHQKKSTMPQNKTNTGEGEPIIFNNELDTRQNNCSEPEPLNNKNIFSREHEHTNKNNGIRCLPIIIFTLSALSLLFLLVFVTDNSENSLLGNSSQLIRNATLQFSQWLTDLSSNISTLQFNDIFYLPVALAAKISSTIYSGIIQLGTAFMGGFEHMISVIYSVSSYMGASMNLVVESIARCLQTVLEIFMLPVNGLINFPGTLAHFNVWIYPSNIFGGVKDFVINVSTSGKNTISTFTSSGNHRNNS